MLLALMYVRIEIVANGGVDGVEGSNVADGQFVWLVERIDMLLEIVVWCHIS